MRFPVRFECRPVIGLAALLTTATYFSAKPGCLAEEPIAIWEKLAPGESSRRTGTLQPFRPSEKPPVSRVVDITAPTMTVHVPEEPNGTGVLILPGGGFAKVVPDKEGTEAAEWLARSGITAFVLSYRTQGPADENGWHKPLQDAQRALSLIRHRADHWNLDRQKIGLLGFSAGGQVAARLLSETEDRVYDPRDDIDKVSYYPNFALLVYPWRVYDEQQAKLAEGISTHSSYPPTFLVHTHDDRSTSVGAALLYAGLRKLQIPAELHIYGNGGHGYGLRPVANSQISSWPDHATHWLQVLKFAN